MKYEEELSVWSQYNLSKYHLKLAKSLTEELKSLEKTDQELSNVYAMGVITSLIAFHESHINELIEETVSIQRRCLIFEDNYYKKAFINWLDFKLKISNESTYSKYLALLSLEKKDLKNHEKKDLFENVRLITNLRNKIIHYDGEFTIEELNLKETTDTSEKSPSKNKDDFLKKIESRIEPNSLYKDSDAAFFPFKCFGYGLASWALNSMIEFTEFFHAEIGVPSKYETHKNSHSELN